MSQKAPVRDSAASYRLAEEIRAVLGKLKRRLREQAPAGELSASQRSAVRQLEQAGTATVSHLARAEGMRPQSMGAIVAALEAAGLVEGHADPEDGRQTVYSLSAACRDRLKAGRAARQDWLCRALEARLSPPEQAQLEQAIALLRRLADS